MPKYDFIVEKLYSELGQKCGGTKDDYFGLIYLEKEMGVDRDHALNQIAFGGNDFGVDGYHFDRERKTLYIYQFKHSENHALFKDSMIRLIDKGMQVIFSPNSEPSSNQILNQLYSCLIENREIIRQVCIRFVFVGDPEEAERSMVLDKLREDLENKKYYLDKFFKREDVSLVVEFRSHSGRVGRVGVQQSSYNYSFELKNCFEVIGPKGEVLKIGLVRLFDLYGVYLNMGNRFFERNIRFGLGADEFVNREIDKAFRRILIDKTDEPGYFQFNHNGVSLYAEKISKVDGKENTYKIVAPKLLNGAQTVTTFANFLERNKDNPKLIENDSLKSEIYVICKIVSEANEDFVTKVTINNNRQNPVEPWALRANDLIQLEIQDRFKADFGIYYERQENAFCGIDLDDEGIVEAKQIKMRELARTFLVADGNIQRLSNLRQVFEDDKAYNAVYNDRRLLPDLRTVVLCYKVQFRLNRLVGSILDTGYNKYQYAPRARNLICPQNIYHFSVEI